MMLRKKQPITLRKKVSLKDKIQQWFNRHYHVFIIAGVIVVLILSVCFVLIFVPGNESGLWFNNRTGMW